MYRCLDMDRIHFIEGDTDSAYWAIAGDPNEDYHQQFKHVIRDDEFYNEHVYEWFPDQVKRCVTQEEQNRIIRLQEINGCTHSRQEH